MTKAFEIIQMNDDHWPGVAKIYEQGIKSGDATFEQSCPSREDWDKTHRKNCRLVAIHNQRVVGWAALSNVSDRCAYSGVAEVSVYVEENFQGRGCGFELLNALIGESEKAGIWTLQAGIFPENETSIHIHEKAGFRIVGVREKLGQMNGVWRDVFFMERRSSIIGQS